MKFNISLLLLILVANQAFSTELPPLRAHYPFAGSLAASEGLLPQPDLLYIGGPPAYKPDRNGAVDSAIYVQTGNYLEWNINETINKTAKLSINFWVKKDETVQPIDSDYTLISIKAKQGAEQINYELKRNSITNNLDNNYTHVFDKNLFWENDWNMVTVSIYQTEWGSYEIYLIVNAMQLSSYNLYTNETDPVFKLESARLGQNGVDASSQFFGSFSNLKIFNGQLFDYQAQYIQEPTSESWVYSIARYNLDSTLQDKRQQNPRLSFKNSETIDEISQGKRVYNRENQPQTAIRLEQGDNLYIPRRPVTLQNTVSIAFWFRTNLVNPLYLLRFVNEQNQEVLNLQNFETIINGQMIDIGQISKGDNTWNFILISLDLIQNQVLVYLNGLQRNSNTVILNTDGQFLKDLKYVQLGQVNTAGGFIDIDDVSIYKNPFTKLQAWKEYHQYHTESDQHQNYELVAAWRLDNNLLDQSNQKSELRYLFDQANSTFGQFQIQNFNGRQQSVKAFNRNNALTTAYRFKQDYNHYFGISFWVKNMVPSTGPIDHFLRIRTIWNPSTGGEYTGRLDFFNDGVQYVNTRIPKDEYIPYSTVPMQSDQWNHIYVSVDRWSSLKIYINEVQVLTGTIGIDLQDFFQAEPQIYFGEKLDGFIHNIRIYEQSQKNKLTDLINFDKNFTDEFGLQESTSYEPLLQYRTENRYNLQFDLKSDSGSDSSYDIIFNTPIANKTLPNTWSDFQSQWIEALQLEEDEYYTVPNRIASRLERDFTITFKTQYDSTLQSPTSEYNLLSLEFWDSYENQNFREIKITKDAIIYDGVTHNLARSLVSEFNLQTVSITYSYFSKQLEFYVQGQLVHTLPVSQFTAIKSINFGKKFNVVIFVINFYNFVLSLEEIRQDIQEYDNQDVLIDLHSYYNIQDGSLKDVLNNSTDLKYQAGAPLFVTDRNGNANGAIQTFKSQVIIEKPLELKSNTTFQSVSITFRAKWSGPYDGTDFLRYQYQEQSDPVIKTNIIHSGDYINNIKADIWQTWTVVFNVPEYNGRDIVVYIDGFQVYRRNYNTDSYFKLHSLIIGEDLNGVGKIVEFDDVMIHKTALSQWEVLEIAELPNDIISSTTNPTEPVKTCEEKLSDLVASNVSVSLNVNYRETQFFHDYVFDLGLFQLDHTCFVTKIVGGLPTDAQQHLSYSERPDQQNIIDLSFPHSNALNSGCKEITPTELECNFQLIVEFNEVVQMTKTTKSIIKTPDLNDIQNGLQLQIQTDSSSIITQFDQSVVTEINFCTDITCATPKTDLVLVRNEITYVQLRIVSEGYNNYYPVHQSLKLGTNEIVPENLSEIQNWNQAGQIVYAIKPHFSSNTLMLSIQIGLSQNPPTTPTDPTPTNSNSTVPNPGDSGSNRRLDQVETEMSLGKQVYVSVVDNENQVQRNQELDFILKISLGAMLFISVMTITLVVGFLRYQSIKKQSSYFQPAQQIDSSSLEKL